jgi:hypothetical protein
MTGFNQCGGGGGRPEVEDEQVDLDGLVDLLAGELEATIAETFASGSPNPARAFADRVIDADLTMAEQDGAEGDGAGNAGALGQSATFLVLATWLSRVGAAWPDGVSYQRAVDWVDRELGAACADAARRAAVVADAPESPDAQRGIAALGSDFLPGLVWLVSGIITEYGNRDPAILRGQPGAD